MDLLGIPKFSYRQSEYSGGDFNRQASNSFENPQGHDEDEDADEDEDEDEEEDVEEEEGEEDDNEEEIEIIEDDEDDVFGDVVEIE